MSFARYPKYKDSGVEWLAEVPEHWHVSRLKYAVNEICSGGTPESGNTLYWAADEEDSIPWVAIGDMTRAPIVKATERRITQAGLDSKRIRVLPTGTLLYSMYASLGKVAVLGLPSAVNQAILGIVPNVAIADENFLRYWLVHIETHLELFSSSNTQDNLNAAKVRSMPLLLPPLHEQSRVGRFLDGETTTIDALVDEQRRLMELLKEKRQAVISNAVTKGLNPDAPMKPSGIEWLGDVPAHWHSCRNKVVFAEVDERSTSDEGELLTVSHITGVTPRSEKAVNMFLAETLEGYKTCRRGDLVINTMWAWMGALGCSPCDGLVSPSYNVYRSRTPDRLSSEFYDYLCRIPPHKVAIKAHSTGIWESRLRLYPDAFLDMEVALPPLAEQIAITRYLDYATAKWDALTAEAQRAIDLLQERRTALISAAVTGQIDVRGVPEMQPA